MTECCNRFISKIAKGHHGTFWDILQRARLERPEIKASDLLSWGRRHGVGAIGGSKDDEEFQGHLREFLGLDWPPVPPRA